MHDERFTAGGEGQNFILPRIKKPILIIHWAEVSADYTFGG